MADWTIADYKLTEMEAALVELRKAVDWKDELAAKRAANILKGHNDDLREALWEDDPPRQ